MPFRRQQQHTHTHTMFFKPHENKWICEQGSRTKASTSPVVVIPLGYRRELYKYWPLSNPLPIMVPFYFHSSACSASVSCSNIIAELKNQMCNYISNNICYRGTNRKQVP